MLSIAPKWYHFRVLTNRKRHELVSQNDKTIAANKKWFWLVPLWELVPLTSFNWGDKIIVCATSSTGNVFRNLKYTLSLWGTCPTTWRNWSQSFLQGSWMNSIDPCRIRVLELLKLVLLGFELMVLLFVVAEEDYAFRILDWLTDRHNRFSRTITITSQESKLF